MCVRPVVCASCIEAAIEDGAGADIAEEICREYGNEIADHDCEGPETRCACRCKSWHRQAELQPFNAIGQQMRAFEADLTRRLGTRSGRGELP